MILQQIYPRSVSPKSSPPPELYFVTEEFRYKLGLFGGSVY